MQTAAGLSTGVLILQLHKCPRATAVLKGSAPFARYAERILLCRVKGENLFETKFMLPPIRQVVLIQPGLFRPEVKVAELYLARIIVEHDAANSPNPVWLPSDEELVQVLVRPAKCHLQDLMQLSNSAVASHEQTTPDLRADSPYPDA